MINALKWMVRFLETRFPEKVVPVSQKEFDGIKETWREREFSQDSALQGLEAKIVEMKKQIEVLNLRVGLSRPMQTVLKQRGSNG